MGDHVEIVDAGITHGEGAVGVDDHRAVDRSIDGAGHGEDERPPFDAEPDPFGFERLPPAIIAIAGAAVVEGQAIDIDQIGTVDGVGPAQILVVAEEGVRRSREIGPGEIPALVRMDHHLVPGDAAGPWLVRVGDEPGCAVGAAGGCDGESVRAVLAFACAEQGVGEVG